MKDELISEKGNWSARLYHRPVLALIVVFCVAGITPPATANHCIQGYVWREAFPGDLVCVKPDVRDQAAEDNAATSSRIATCRPGFVPREAVRGDEVCVTPTARDLAASENEMNPDRSTFIECARLSVDSTRCPNPAPCKRAFVYRQATPKDYVCATPEARVRVSQENSAHPKNKGVNTCIDGYVWRAAAPNDLVCVKPEVRNQAAQDNAAADSRVDPRHAQCETYARTAVTQAEEYFSRGCGQPSDRWQTSYDNHFNFCMGPHGGIAEKETRARKGTLSQCRTINPLPGAPGGAIGGVCNMSATVRNTQCLNADGTPSSILAPGSLTAVGCGVDQNAALTAAKENFTNQAAIADDPTPGACTYTAEVVQGCLCR